MGKPEFEEIRRTSPFVTVGVTGHRHLANIDRPLLAERIRSFFLENFTAEDHVLILDGLAEGADQLTAEVVLDLKRELLPGLRLIGILPMPLSFYEEDFAEEMRAENDSVALSPRASFYRLLRQTDQIVELPLIPQNQELALSQNPINRLVQYDLLGQQIASRSNVLLALWDGVRTGLKPGGSGDVVRRVLGRFEGGNVFQIVTPQTKKGAIRPQNALENFWRTQWATPEE